MAEKNKEVAVVKAKRAVTKKHKTPAETVNMEQVFLEAIRTPGLDPANLKQLVEIKKELEAMEAEKAFNQALAAFQGEVGVIYGKKEGSKTSAGELVFKYAPLDQIIPIIQQPLAKNGLSITYDSSVDDKGKRKTTCTVTHEMGHSQSATFESVQVEGTNLMSNLQKDGATISYHRRYSLLMALNIVTAGEDDEVQHQGENGKTAKTLTKAQVKIIEKQIGTADETLYRAILTAYRITELNQISADKFKDCKDRISNYKKAKLERKKEVAT